MTEISDLEKRLGERFRALRQAYAWSQARLNKELNALGYDWHPSTIAKIELGQRPLRVNEAEDIAMLFGLHLTDLLSSETTPARDRLELERSVRKRIAAEILASIPDSVVNHC